MIYEPHRQPYDWQLETDDTSEVVDTFATVVAFLVIGVCGLIAFLVLALR